MRAQQRWQSKSQEGLFDFSRSISFFRTASNISCLPLLVGLHAWQHPYYITKICHWDVLDGHRLPSTLTFFLQKIFARSTSLFLPLFTFETTWEVFFFYISDGGSRDRDIMFRYQRYLVFCFLGCVVKFQARKAYNNSWRRSTSSNPCNWVCVFFLFLSFLFFFFFLPTFSIFSRSNAHRHSHNQGRCRETWKGRKETLESSSLHSIWGLQISVWLGVII